MIRLANSQQQNYFYNNMKYGNSRFFPGVADRPVIPAEKPLMSFQNLLQQIRNLLVRWRRRRLRQAHLRLGRMGERAAARLLDQSGAEILCRNYRSGHDEIDIVARENCVLCFIEVKTRRYKPGIRPAEAVTAEKRHHIIRGARRYLREIGSPELPLRFDIIEVLAEGWKIREIRHGRNAFRKNRNR